VTNIIGNIMHFLKAASKELNFRLYPTKRERPATDEAQKTGTKTETLFKMKTETKTTFFSHETVFQLKAMNSIKTTSLPNTLSK